MNSPSTVLSGKVVVGRMCSVRRIRSTMDLIDGKQLTIMMIQVSIDAHIRTGVTLSLAMELCVSQNEYYI